MRRYYIFINSVPSEFIPFTILESWVAGFYPSGHWAPLTGPQSVTGLTDTDKLPLSGKVWLWDVGRSQSTWGTHTGFTEHTKSSRLRPNPPTTPGVYLTKPDGGVHKVLDWISDYQLFLLILPVLSHTQVKKLIFQFQSVLFHLINLGQGKEMI